MKTVRAFKFFLFFQKKINRLNTGLLPINVENEGEVIVHKREFDFQFIALGFFSRLLVRFLNSTSFNVTDMWLNGLVLQDTNGDKALIVNNVNHLNSLYNIKIVSQFSEKASPKVNLPEPELNDEEIDTKTPENMEPITTDKITLENKIGNDQNL